MENNKFLPSDLMSSSPNRLTEAPRRLIPKVIHYCWFGSKPFSRTVRKCISTWHKHLSDYKFCLWNEESCAAYAEAHNIANPMEHPFVKSAYVAEKYAFVADYVRFWALYHCGGIYLDTDMYVVKSFDDLLYDDFFAGWETPSCEYLNVAILGSTKSNSCLKKVLLIYDLFEFDKNKMNKFIVPRIITPVFNQDQSLIIYPYDYFYAFPWGERNKNNPEKYVTKNTYTLHLWDISWTPWYKKILKYLIIQVKKIKKNND